MPATAPPPPAPPEVLLLGAAGWHGRELARAVRARGGRVRRLPFPGLGLVTGGVRLGGAAGAARRGRLPEAAIVRSIPAGSFEQVTARLAALHALAELGVAVVNDARAIERCVDKGTTCFRLARAGLPVPESWTTEDPAEARAILAREASRGRRLVLKPLFGSQGRGLRLLADADGLPPPEAVEGGVYHLQRFVGADAGWHDYRVLVVGGEPVAAMLRRGTSWVTNVRRGGRPEPVPVAGELGALAARAALAVGAALAGVDLIRDPSGRAYLLEVNSMPAWRGLQAVTPFPIADRVAAATLALAARDAATRGAAARAEAA